MECPKDCKTEDEMRNLALVSELYQQYRRGGLEKKKFEGLLFQYLVDNMERYHLFEGNREKWNDFLSWLYPRLSRAMDAYKEAGASFDAYITSIIRWSAKEYRSREADHYATEFACWKAKVEETLVCDAEPEYPDTKIPNLPVKNIATPRQILMLLLKSYYFVSDDFLNRIAAGIGIEKANIRNMIDELRRRRAAREEEIRNLQERIQCQYYRCLSFQHRLASAFPDTAYYEKLKGRLERARKRFSAMRKRLEGIRVDATNRQIAEVMGIPKGTVDSSLHTVRAKWRMEEEQGYSRN
jgi:DNA-directed RNA polymerase specialized sigma24 family protein